MNEQKNNSYSLGSLVAAIGVVYGDIGTSPIYALKECFRSKILDLNPENIIAICSLIIWSLFLIVSIKYIVYIFRADNNSEGGILSLTTLCLKYEDNKSRIKIITFLGIIGTSLFFGDGIITPAISVLGALEGIELVSNKLSSYTILISVIIILLLFLLQSKGSAKIGYLFGPIMVIWFLVIGSLGLKQIITNPEIFKSFNPIYAFKVLTESPKISMIILGIIVLSITGAEALYADIGHFSKKSIRVSWNYFIFPALILNYLGQGSILLMDSSSIGNPFYNLCPSFMIIPMIILTTIATIIASQSVISGVFSLSWQAIQLGFFPRVNVIHTSSKNIGQVYVPSINYIMLFLTISVVLIFNSSGNLTYAYGFSVTGLMCITTILTSLLAINCWNWSKIKTTSIFLPFLIIDTLLFTSNIIKLFAGAWISLLITILIYFLIDIWIKGRSFVNKENLTKHNKDLTHYLKELTKDSDVRIPGITIFMSREFNIVPLAFKLHVAVNKFLHQNIIFLTIKTEKVPRIAEEERIKIFWEIEPRIYQILVQYGFAEVPIINDVSFILKKKYGIDISSANYVLSKKYAFVTGKRVFLNYFQEVIFMFLMRNSTRVTDLLELPCNRAFEISVKE